MSCPGSSARRMLARAFRLWVARSWPSRTNGSKRRGWILLGRLIFGGVSRCSTFTGFAAARNVIALALPLTGAGGFFPDFFAGFSAIKREILLYDVELNHL